jgi:hypothetical protein
MGIFDFLTPKADGLAYDPMRLPAGADPENDPVVGYDELGQKIRRSRFDGTEYLFEMAPPKTQSVIKGAYREATANPLGFTGDLLSNAVQSAWDAISVPARSMAGEPITYGDIAGLTGMVTLGAGAGTAPAGALRMGAAREGRPPVTFADAERAMQETPGIRAYQGSPHNFAAERLVRMPDGSTQYIVGKPDVLPDVPAGAEVLQDFPLGRMRMDKLGTGEGAQAYGPGLYTAQNEGIARHYRDMLATPGTASLITRASPDAHIPHGSKIREIAASLGDGLGQTPEEFKSSIVSRLRNPSENAGQYEREQLNMIADELEAGLWDVKPSTMGDKGSMYEVNINADPKAFLDSDLPLAKQSQSVRDALQPIIAGMKDARMNEFDRKEILSGKASGSLLYSALKNSGKGAEAFDRAAAATDALRSVGIPGIKYLDQGSRYTPANLPNNPIANEARQFLDAAQGDSGKALQMFRDSNPTERWASTERDEIRKVIEAAAKPVTRNFVVFDENLISIVRKYGIAGAAVMLGTSADQISQTLTENMTQEELNNLVSGA